MGNKIKFVYFDVGNVFMTFDKIFARVAKDLNIDQNLIDNAEEKYDIDANLGKIDIPEVWQKICEELKIEGGENTQLLNRGCPIMRQSCRCMSWQKRLQKNIK